MANVRELLARLNPSTVKFDVGRGGGAPTLTSQDIAAGLGMVPPGLGREVLIACWWPDGARLDGATLAKHVLTLVGAEWRRQGEQLQEARLDLSIAEACAGWHGVANPAAQREVARARARFDAARKACWPKDLPAMLPVLTRAVVDEISRRKLCPCCEGRREVMSEELKVACPDCKGSGVTPLSDRERAEKAGKHLSRYQETWRPAYEFLLRALRDAEQEAAASLRRALQQAS